MVMRLTAGLSALDAFTFAILMRFAAGETLPLVMEICFPIKKGGRGGFWWGKAWGLRRANALLSKMDSGSTREVLESL